CSISLRATCVSTNVTLPSLVTKVRVGGTLPSSVQVPTRGCQSLMAQNGPIVDHTIAGVAATSALRISSAAEAGEIPLLSTPMDQTLSMATRFLGARFFASDLAMKHISTLLSFGFAVE